MTDPNGDSVAIRFDWGDSTESHWQGWFASGETVAFSHTWTDTGTYEVHAWAEDQKLLTSDSSSGITVQVAIRQPPEMPSVPIGPHRGVQDSSYTFTTAATHPDDLPVAIRFAWGDGDTSDWSDFVASGESVAMSHAWSQPDTCCVTAQAEDTGNALSSWSPPCWIVVGSSRHLRMIGQPLLAADSSGFLINVANDGDVQDTISWLAILAITPDSAYLRDFQIDVNEGIGFPLGSGVPGKGAGDTLYFAPATIPPNLSQEVPLMFRDFRVSPSDTSAMVHIAGKQFQFGFSDGSEITATIRAPF